MPKTTKAEQKRLYKKYHSSRKAKTERNMRNQNRRRAKRAGTVRKGDGMEIDHKVPLSKGGSNNKSNLRIVTRKTNRAKKDRPMRRSKR
jgi:5-methylcytosine-specific restriction endonuclease McrA